MGRLDVVDLERCRGDALFGERRRVRLRGRVLVGLEQQLDAVGSVSADDGQPAVLADGDVGLRQEPSISV